MEGFKRHILPSAVNVERAKREHSKRTGKGVYFQTGVDKIYFRHVYNTPSFASCMRNLPPSALKTENIQSFAMDWVLCRSRSRAFHNLCVPHIFLSDPNFPEPKPEHMLPNLTEFVLVCSKPAHDYYESVSPTYYDIEWLGLDRDRRVVEGYGLSGRLVTFPVFEADFEGWSFEGSRCVDVKPRMV